MMRNCRFSLAASLVAVMLVCSPAAIAGYTYDFESGLEGWGPSGFGSGASQQVSLSPTGATQGSAQAMSFGHEKQAIFPQSFSWDASIVLSPPSAGQPAGSPGYQALSAAYANPAGLTLDLDITWDQSALPTSGWTFGNVSVSVQDDNAFRQIDGLAEISFGDSLPQTFSLSLPLDSGNLAGGIPNSGFYRITIAANVDAGAGENVGAFADNIHIVPEPMTAGLAGLGLTLLLLRRR